MYTNTPTPYPSEFASDHETLVRFLGEIDSLGRRRFVAYWISDGRVRGQFFFTNYYNFVGREAREHRTVRAI